MTRPFRYPWPASQLSPTDMRLLHDARKTHPDRPPITRLLAEAVRAAYGQTVEQASVPVRMKTSNPGLTDRSPAA